MNRLPRGTILIAFLSLLGVGCGGSEEQEAGSNPPEDVNPLTREEIREQAEAMSPEVAESLGIVDTTIKVQSPVSPESVPLVDTAAER
ncbi:MAG TPA: hypothetical protein VF167_12535 [Longimicrobiaceae bacterium]